MSIVNHNSEKKLTVVIDASVTPDQFASRRVEGNVTLVPNEDTAAPPQVRSGPPIQDLIFDGS